MYVFNHALTDVFCIIIFLLLIIYFNRSLAVLSEVDTFHNMIASAIIYGISDILCLFGDNGYFRMSADLNFILSVTFLISFALTAYFRTVFITGRLRFEYVQNRLYKVLLVIPVVVSSLLCIGSFGTGLVFYINEANVYSTGPLYHVYAICLNIYNVLLLIEFIIVFVKGDQYRGKKEKLILLSFFILPIIADIIRIYIPGSPVILTSIAFPSIMLCVNMQNSGISIDSLTGLENRRSADKYIEEAIKKCTEKKGIYLILIDIDNFQKINSKYGSYESDKLLQALGEALRNVSERFGGFCARYGGDDFLFVCETRKSNSPESIMELFDILLRESSKKIDLKVGVFSVSYGYAVCNDFDTRVSELIRAADRALYANKISGKITDGNKSILSMAADENELYDRPWLWVYAPDSDTDKTTLLPNSGFFKNQSDSYIANSLSKGRNPAAIYFKLDNLGALNKEYGFHEGDKFLKNFSDILRDRFKEDLMARLRSAHFAVITDKSEVEDIIKNINEQIELYKKELSVRMRAGLYYIDGTEPGVNSVLDRAKSACDFVKDNYSAFLRVYDSKLEEENKRRSYILNHFEEAMKNGRIKVMYHPIVRIDNGAAVGAEALSRWDDPKYGLIMPKEFVEILEKHKIVHNLDIYVLRKLCSDYRSLREELGRDIDISFNLSGVDFEICDIVKEIIKITDEYSVPPRNIKIEIAESALSMNEDMINSAVSELHRAGFEVWMDDFGSGYSSLNLLAHTEFDIVKLDMLYLRNVEASSNVVIMLENLIEMISKMKKQVLVEGVETVDKLVFLRDTDCKMGQGYLFSEPVAPEKLKEILS